MATRQKRIEGTADEVPEEVQEKVDKYVDTLRKRQKLQATENTLREEVLELLHRHELTEIELDDEKYLALVEGEEKVKIKKRKASAATSPATNGEAN